MSNEELVGEWLRRARSNLARAKAGKISEEITFEDLCYDAQQTAEKALKGLCIHLGITFPRTHNIGQLLSIIAAQGYVVPSELDDIDALMK